MKKFVIILYSIPLVLDVAAFVFDFFSGSINAAVGFGLMLIFAIPLLPISFLLRAGERCMKCLPCCPLIKKKKVLVTLAILLASTSLSLGPIFALVRSWNDYSSGALTAAIPHLLIPFSWSGMSNCWLIANVFSRRESQKQICHKYLQRKVFINSAGTICLWVSSTALHFAKIALLRKARHWSIVIGRIGVKGD